MVPLPHPFYPPFLQVKNVGSDVLDGKVGRIYMKPQNMATMGLAKMKGLKRERRKAAADESAAKKAPKRLANGEGAGSENALAE